VINGETIMRYRSLLCSVVAAALLCVASQAGAVTTTINATFESLIGVGDATISGLDVPNGSEGCSMGSMYFRVNSIDGIAPVAGTGFTAYCVDVHDDIGWGQTDTWTLTYLADVPHGFQMGATTAGQVAKLFGEVAGDSNVDSDPTKAAAFQAALWQIINGPGFKVTCGETDVMAQA
jgi:hypothetical protein